jgi:hypothetical protein
MIFLLVLINFAISWFNSWSVGRGWAESKARGGWPRFMSWMGAIMAASGFTWCYLIILAVIIYMTGYLDEQYVEAMLALGYLVIILPVLGSGLAITVDSWGYFWRRRTFGSGAVAGYNTFAQVYNTYQAARAIPEAFGKVFDVFGGSSKRRSSSSKNDGAAALLVIALVVVALLGGILTAAAIIRSTARRHAYSVQFKHEASRAEVA